MRHARSLHILAIACAGGGVVAGVSAMCGVGGMAETASTIAPVMLMIGAVAGAAVGSMYWRALRRLAKQLTAAADSVEQAGAPAADRADGPTPEPGIEILADSAHRLIRSADQRVAAVSSKLREVELRLRLAEAERQHAEAILYSISDAVLVTDPFDDVVLANESAARTFDFELPAAPTTQSGQRPSLPMADVLRDPAIVRLIREVRRGGGTSGRRIVEHQVQTPQGPRTFKLTLSTVNDVATATRNGAVQVAETKGLACESAGVVAVLHDVTREKEVADMKNDFVSMVSHELRTPLASIKAYVEMLIDGEAVDERTKAEFYEVIQNEANRLGRLIDNILNISRIESGLVKINRQPQSLTVIVKEALEIMAPQVAQKGIRIVERLTPVLYQTSADRDMLYQAVLNLLANAVKYTPAEGTITVETTVDEATRKVTARISDTGVGIAARDLPFVFDKFYRADANKRMANGSGLGLSLVKHIIETVHGGRILVESRVGKGSCFGFELELC